MALVSDHPLHLLGLRFPLRLRVTVRQGFVTLHNEIATKKLASGDSFVVPAFLRFACDVMPGRGKPAVFTLALEGDEPDGGHGGGKRWSQALAQHIFDTPQGKWTAARLAALWQVTPHKARARLFAEGEALLSLVREQRLAHACTRRRKRAPMAKTAGAIWRKWRPAPVLPRSPRSATPAWMWPACAPACSCAARRPDSQTPL